MPGLGYLLTFFVLKDIIRKGYFWKKHTLMFTINFDFKNWQKIVH